MQTTYKTVPHRCTSGRWYGTDVLWTMVPHGRARRMVPHRCSNGSWYCIDVLWRVVLHRCTTDHGTAQSREHWIECKRGVLITWFVWVSATGVQDTLLQNMAPWQNEYSLLKESEEWHLQKALNWRSPPHTRRRGASLPQQTKGHAAESKGTGLAWFPPFLAVLSPLSYGLDPRPSLFIKPGTEILKFSRFFRSSFPT